MQARQLQAMRPAGGQQAAGQSAAVGSPTWVRQVMAIIAPPDHGYVKRCSCVVCGAPKKLPNITAYVYCDYCASLIDYDLRQACTGDTAVGPAYAAAVNSAQAASQAAIAAGDREGYRALQRQVYEAYVLHVPMAVSHRARNDPAYRSAYVEYLAAAAVARAFDPDAQALEAEMRQRVMGLRYTGDMMSPTVAPDSFWPMADTLEKADPVRPGLVPLRRARPARPRRCRASGRQAGLVRILPGLARPAASRRGGAASAPGRTHQ